MQNQKKFDFVEPKKPITIVLYLIAAAISGGAITSGFDYFLHDKQVDQNALEKAVEVYMKDNDRLRDVERDCAEQATRINALQQAVVLLRGSHQDFPLPWWIKDRNGVMMDINKPYERAFLSDRGYSRSDYVGFTDFCCYDSAQAVVYQAHDRLVMETGKPFVFDEEVIIKGQTETWRVYKYPRYSGNLVIGIEGFIVPPKSFKLD
jgi:hypothetical protein